MVDFLEVADRVWVARNPWADANVTAIGSDRGVVVVDTHGSTEPGRTILGDLARLGAGDVVAVVNTHWHWDHSFGNAAFREVDPEVPIHAHENAATWLAEHGEATKARFTPETDLEHHEEVDATEIVVPDRLFSSAAVLDLGDRTLELVHPGRGHTVGDLVVRVPDVDVLLGGDLVEESARPWIGMDSWPLDWPLTLDIVLGVTTGSSVVVPGHGVVVDRAFVEEQRNTVGIVAETIRDLAARGVPVDQALDAGDWPWPREGLADAVRRGYEQLPRSQKRLPLI